SFTILVDFGADEENNRAERRHAQKPKRMLFNKILGVKDDEGKGSGCQRQHQHAERSEAENWAPTKPGMVVPHQVDTRNQDKACDCTEDEPLLCRRKRPGWVHLVVHDYSDLVRISSLSFRCRTRSPDCSEDPGGRVYLEVVGTWNIRFGLIIPVPLAPNHIC